MTRCNLKIIISVRDKPNFTKFCIEVTMIPTCAFQDYSWHLNWVLKHRKQKILIALDLFYFNLRLSNKELVDFLRDWQIMASTS
jgi:hypothetical protein